MSSCLVSVSANERMQEKKTGDPNKNIFGLMDKEC